MKTTKEFVKQFNLDKENAEFSREEFLAELNNFFLEIMFKAISVYTPEDKESKLLNLHRLSASGRFTFDMFKQAIKQTEQKFWAISNKKSGLPFTKKLWGAFYAIYVVPRRKYLFPEIEEQIALKRVKYLNRCKQD